MKGLITLFLVAAVAGCGPRKSAPSALTPVQNAGKAVETAAKNPQETADDLAVTGRAKTAFSLNKVLNGTDINVTTNRGVVTLEGRVGSAAQKAEAARQAKRVDGVRAVVNKLQVGPAAR